MPDYRKSITFQAKLDTSDVGPTIENLKKQFNEVSASVNNIRNQGATASRLGKEGFGGLMSVPKPDDIQKSRRALDQFIREQAQQQERLFKLIESQKDKMEKLQNIKRTMLKDSKEELALEERKVAAKEELIRLNDQYQRRNENINRALDMRAGGGAGGALSNVSVAAIGKVVGSAAALAAGAAEIYQQFKELPMQRAIATGAGVQSAFGDQLQAIASGDVVNQIAFMPERAEAMRKATEISNAKDITDLVKAPLGAVNLVGSALGMNIGSKDLGNLLAGNLTNLVGAKGASEQYLSTYQAERMAEKMANFQQMSQAAIQSNPLKNLAAQRLQGNFMQDLQTQRMLGLGFEGFAGRGGFQERANMAGFNPQIAAAMAAQMQGAGGSTRGLQGLSVLGMQAQRGFDLTNAGGVLGRISGAAGGGAASEQIFKRVMEESIKAGLDRSEFREEQRRFADATSEILSQAGVKTAEDAANVLQGFSKFLGANPTIREIAGARSAYEESQGFSAETSGRGGALQFAAMMKNPVLKNLGTRGVASLMEIPTQDLIPSNPLVIAQAAQAGVSPEEMVKQAKSAKLEQSYVAIGLDQNKIQSLNSYLTKRGLDKQDLTAEDLNKMKTGTDEDQEAFDQYMQLQNAVTVRNQYSGIAKRRADVLGLLKGGGEGGAEAFGAEYERKLKAPTGRPEDEVVAATGAAAQAMLENFRQFKTEITPAASALDAFTKKMVLFVQVLNSTADVDKGTTLRYLSEHLFEGRGAKNQAQGGKPGK